MVTVKGLVFWPAKSLRRLSATTRALLSLGITVSSTGVQTALSAGRASASITAAVTTATSPGRRITACESRYQAPSLSGRSGRRRRLASFWPQMANSAGEIVSAAAAATRATTAPAMPIDWRKPSGKRVSVIRAADTVAALKATVRPAVVMVVRIAAAPAPELSSSSR